jgi:hypothetical protein
MDLKDIGDRIAFPRNTGHAPDNYGAFVFSLFEAAAVIFQRKIAFAVSVDIKAPVARQMHKGRKRLGYHFPALRLVAVVLRGDIQGFCLVLLQ